MGWDLKGAWNHQHFWNMKNLKFSLSLLLPSHMPFSASSVTSFLSYSWVLDVLVKCGFLCNQQARTGLIFVLDAACCFVSWLVAYVGLFWLNQIPWNWVPTACPNCPGQGQGVVLTVCLAEAEMQFPRSWQAPYRNWVMLLSTPDAVFSKQLSWRWRRKNDGLCSHWFCVVEETCQLLETLK